MGAADIDADGVPDILIACGNELHVVGGADLAATPSRELSMDDGLLHIVGEGFNDSLAVDFDANGDVDGDGRVDLFISAPYDNIGGETWSGTVFGFLGSSLAARTSDTLSTAEADLWLVGEANSDLLGELGGTVGYAGDVDGDGTDDLLVGSGRSDQAGEDAGEVYLLFGATLGAASGSFLVANADYSFLGTDAGSNLGSAVAGVGDVDRDGQADLLMSERFDRNLIPDGGEFYLDAGAVYVVRGASVTARPTQTRSMTEADAAIFGDETQEFLGWTVRAGGDLDGDGRGDVLAGSLQRPDGSSTQSGVVSVFLSGL